MFELFTIDTHMEIINRNYVHHLILYMEIYSQEAMIHVEIFNVITNSHANLNYFGYCISHLIPLIPLSFAGTR